MADLGLKLNVAEKLRRWHGGKEHAITAAALAQIFRTAEHPYTEVDVRQAVRELRITDGADIGSDTSGGFYWIKRDAEYADLERNLKGRIIAIAEVLAAVRRNRRAFNAGRRGRQESLLGEATS